MRLRHHLAASFVILFPILLWQLAQPQSLDSANLTSVKNTLSSSRFSYYGALAAGNSSPSSVVTIKTTGYPSTNTGNLFAGDTAWIGTGVGASNYIVSDIIDDDQFQITAGLAAATDDTDDLVIATRSATHTVTFTPATAIINGSFRVKIAAGNSSSTNNDGLPNHDGFDFNFIDSDDIAPSGGSITWGTKTATANGATSYHTFKVGYTGTNDTSTALTLRIGDTSTLNTDRLINPAPGTGHTQGTADTYTIIVEHLDESDNIIDSTTAKIAVIESVRVTATVDPTITFTIAGVNSGTSVCNVSTSVTTTATSVPFGTMALNTFKTLAHNLTVSTNAVGGYTVTAIENDQLGKDGATSPFIPDTPCNSGPCTHTTEQEWTTATNNGFGYSLENVDASTIPFEYDTGGGSFKTKQFPATADTESPETIFSSPTYADSQNAYVCYRLSVGATQPAGDYENNITYTATATF